MKDRMIRIVLTAIIGSACFLSVTQAAIVANFTDGVGASFSDQYEGIAGDGWSTGWLSGWDSDLDVLGSINTNSPLNATNANYLTMSGDVILEEPISATKVFANLQRGYTAYDAATPVEVSFLFRVEADNTNGGGFWLVGENGESGAGAGTGASDAWVIFGSVGGNWRAKNASLSLDTIGSGLAVQVGDVYRFTVVENNTDLSYSVSVQNVTESSAVYTLNNLGYRTTSYTTPYLRFITQVNNGATPGAAYAFSVDDISITPVTVPEPVAGELISENFDETGLATDATVNGLTFGGSLGATMDSNSDYVLGTNAAGGFVTGKTGASGNRVWHVGFTEADVPGGAIRFSIDMQCYTGMGGQDFGLYVGDDNVINTSPLAIRLSPSGSDTKISVRSFGTQQVDVSYLSGGGMATYVIEYDFVSNLVTEVSVNGSVLLSDYTPTSSVPAVVGVGGKTFGIEYASGGPMLDELYVESLYEPELDPFIEAIELAESGLLKITISGNGWESRKLVGATNLVSGVWDYAAHSDDGVNPFVVTNLSYSTEVDSTQRMIYVQSSTETGFFGVE